MGMGEVNLEIMYGIGKGGEARTLESDSNEVGKMLKLREATGRVTVEC